MMIPRIAAAGNVGCGWLGRGRCLSSIVRRYCNIFERYKQSYLGTSYEEGEVLELDGYVGGRARCEK
jgi:hypothetical protein